jgi:hypothetical protein
MHFTDPTWPTEAQDKLHNIAIFTVGRFFADVGAGDQ